MTLPDALSRLRESARRVLSPYWYPCDNEKGICARLLLAQCDYIESQLPTAVWLECAANNWEGDFPVCKLVRAVIKEAEGL